MWPINTRVRVCRGRQKRLWPNVERSGLSLSQGIIVSPPHGEPFEAWYWVWVPTSRGAPSKRYNDDLSGLARVFCPPDQVWDIWEANLKLDTKPKKG